MDPTTTLFTFMLQTHPSVRVVHLIGSWDNFTKLYTMERDSRRDRSQWKGCYNFKDITCEGESGSIPKRNGGLKMGHTYYYYYELDGASETYDASQPSTTTCPYLPGQTVNTLWIPVEQSGRKRSASLTSLRDEDFKTMDPASKFMAPRPAPSPPEPARRLGTAPLRTQQPPRRPSRSPSPGSRWILSTRKLFSRKSSSSSLRDTASQVPRAEDERSLRSEGSRSRDISPESLRRFLVDDVPLDLEHEDHTRPAIIDIPEDIAEENEDDDNFATSAVSETMQFTGLSPPPQRAVSPALTVTSYFSIPPAAPTRPPPRAPTLQIPSAAAFTTSHAPPSDFYPLSALRAYPSPQSPDSASLPGFYHSEDEADDDDEPLPGNDDVDIDDDQDEDTMTSLPIQTNSNPSPTNPNPFARNLAATLSTYSLPRTAVSAEEKKLVGGPGGAGGAEGAPMLPMPVADAGLGQLVSELGWMADFI